MSAIRSCRGFALLKGSLELSKEVLEKIELAEVVIPYKGLARPIAPEITCITIWGNSSGSNLAIFVYYLPIYLFISLFLSVLSRSGTWSRHGAISAAVAQLSLMGAKSHFRARGQQPNGDLPSYLSLAEQHQVAVNRVIQPQPPSLKALPLTGAPHCSGPPHPLCDREQKSEPPSPKSSDHTGKPQRVWRDLGVQMCGTSSKLPHRSCLHCK